METLIIRRLVVLGVMPKRRNDSAIYEVLDGILDPKELLCQRLLLRAASKIGWIFRSSGKQITNLIIWAEGEHDFGMNIPTL